MGQELGLNVEERITKLTCCITVFSNDLSIIAMFRQSLHSLLRRLSDD
jgi:hypothetical protein